MSDPTTPADPYGSGGTQPGQYGAGQPGQPQQYGAPGQQPYPYGDPSAKQGKPGRTLSIIGIVLAVLSLFILPIIFGPVGAILGFVAYSKGDKPLGLYVGIGAIVAMVVGFVLGALLFASTN